MELNSLHADYVWYGWNLQRPYIFKVNPVEEKWKKMNKIEFFKFRFSNLLKVSGTFGVDVALE